MRPCNIDKALSGLNQLPFLALNAAMLTISVRPSPIRWLHHELSTCRQTHQATATAFSCVPLSRCRHAKTTRAIHFLASILCTISADEFICIKREIVSFCVSVLASLCSLFIPQTYSPNASIICLPLNMIHTPAFAVLRSTVSAWQKPSGTVPSVGIFGRII